MGQGPFTYDVRTEKGGGNWLKSRLICCISGTVTRGPRGGGPKNLKFLRTSYVNGPQAGRKGGRIGGVSPTLKGLLDRKIMWSEWASEGGREWAKETEHAKAKRK